MEPVDFDRYWFVVGVLTGLFVGTPIAALLYHILWGEPSKPVRHGGYQPPKNNNPMPKPPVGSSNTQPPRY